MKPVLTILSYLLIMQFNLFAQKRNNIWYFGDKIGVNFNVSPPQILNDGQLIYDEGGTVLSDANGKLLFYSNGSLLLNGKHKVVKNGVGLLGDLSSTNNAVLVPMPKNDTLFYLFTVGAADRPNKGLRYNVINKNGDNGNGEVVQKNIQLLDNCYEKIAITHHCNGVDFWVVVKEFNSNQYYTYSLTSSGINTTPIVSIGTVTVDKFQNNAIGILKFSVDGKKIAAAHSYENNLVELFDFDNTTGSLYNSIFFKPANATSQIPYAGVYSVEFSPNANLLYVSYNAEADGDGQLYQFDITSHNAITIYNSKQLISSHPGSFSAGLQLASDGKIYHCINNGNYLATVNNPNNYGLSCGYNTQGIFLGNDGSNKLKLGLPTLVNSYFDPTLISYEIQTNSRLCTDKTASFVINTTVGTDSIRWDFGDGNFSTTPNPSHTYLNEGLYTVIMKAYSTRCGIVKQDISTLKIFIANDNDLLDNNIGICDTINAKLIPKKLINGANYTWSTGEITPEIRVKTVGKYWLNFATNNCTLPADTANVFQKPKPVVNLGKDTSVCKTKPIVLSTPFYNNATYGWNTGEISSQIKINSPGVYSVSVTQDCIVTDTINVFAGDCEFFIPNAFTPDGNNQNDLFGPATIFTSKNYEFVIFDRWGKAVFKSNNSLEKWDGTRNGKQMPMGSYFWNIAYTTLRGINKYEQGMVTLIR
jgi:gliding motility-associated-like protein